MLLLALFGFALFLAWILSRGTDEVPDETQEEEDEDLLDWIILSDLSDD